MKTCHENPESIVAGSYHRTRDGQKAFIQSVNLPFNGIHYVPAVNGMIVLPDNDGEPGISAMWEKSGYEDEDETESENDLVCEWKEPKKIIRWMVSGESFECLCATEQEAILLSMKMQVVENVSSKKIMLIGYE